MVLNGIVAKENILKSHLDIMLYRYSPFVYAKLM